MIFLRNLKWRKLSRLIPPLFLFLAVGCDFLQPHVRVEVVLPPGPWGEAGVPVFYLLRFPSLDKEGLRTLRVPAGSRRVVIELPRGSSVPVLAYPLGRLKPVGGLLGPLYEGGGLSRRGVLRLDAPSGALAEMFLSLRKNRFRCATVNTMALVDEMSEEGDGDPWACDMGRIKQAVLIGSLNYLQVRDVERYSCSAILPAGDWIAETELWRGEIESEPSVAVSREGEFRVEFTGLYPGCHRYYSPRTGLELHIHVDKKGDCRLIYGSLSDFSPRF